MKAKIRASVTHHCGVMASFYGEHAEASAATYIETLPDHEDGRYGLEVSILCLCCATYHHEDADCR